MESKELYWCIADEFENIRSRYPSESWLSDSGIGMVWSKEWKQKWQSVSPQREKRFCPSVGLEVWYYPDPQKADFFSWLDSYIEIRKNRKSQQPVLPKEGYLPNTQYSGKTIYFTGFYPDDKRIISDLVVPITGIKADDSFRKTTQVLVMGPNRGPSKIQKAQGWGIPCVSVEIFVDEVTR